MRIGFIYRADLNFIPLNIRSCARPKQTQIEGKIISERRFTQTT